MAFILLLADFHCFLPVDFCWFLFSDVCLLFVDWFFEFCFFIHNCLKKYLENGLRSFDEIIKFYEILKELC